jgi:hypothetical protein
VRSVGPAPEIPPTREPWADLDLAVTYSAAGVRRTLAARTLASVASPRSRSVTHAAAGDGLTLTWTFDAEPSGPDAHVRTWLRASIAVALDTGHPLATDRRALFRAVARRAPGDLARLQALLDRTAGARAGRSAPSP